VAAIADKGGLGCGWSGGGRQQVAAIAYGSGLGGCTARKHSEHIHLRSLRTAHGRIDARILSTHGMLNPRLASPSHSEACERERDALAGAGAEASRCLP